MFRMSPNRAKAHVQPPSGETVLPILYNALPYSAPLYGRLRFHHRSPSSHVFASFPPSLQSVNLDNSMIPRCYAIAFLDRTRRPETECWLFTSGEVPNRCSLSSQAKHCDDCKAALVAVLDAVFSSNVPESNHSAETMKQASPEMQRALKGEIMLLGAVNEVTAKIVWEATANTSTSAPADRAEVPYLKYLFRPEALPRSQDLPTGFKWGKVRREEFALVRSRTSIPRQDQTLTLLPSMAIFPDDGENHAPIAWAFLGPDGSLISLHTEPEFRGKGFAKSLASKLFREGDFVTQTKSNPAYSTVWYHADVALDNNSSRRVCKGLGGEEAWIVYWIRVDLKALKDPIC
ncbi:uncharacterized protein PV09_04743 [Verruconis gallopava]|uniref:GCN5-related N-acetyltransferase Rv2170-like domain-containing protein n=1 Tax=Verruconis gallopava TaxID=253628 RepID=A0A0D2ABG4_9PEZI|nr:uncharacterized protein PV09_04743 [Verruconis gallopava]KIW03900.1 hypothetical protein PV09_04743 [Verruconis gallopava]